MTKIQLEHMLELYKIQQSVDELYWLYGKLEKLKPNIILEIGVKYGGTLKVWESLFSTDNCLLMGIDNKHHQPSWPYKANWNIKTFIGDSTEDRTRKLVISALDKRELDFLFIDGSHDYNKVLLDFEEYLPLVKRGGIIGMHDICTRQRDPEPIETDGFHGCVDRLWKQIKLQFRTEEFYNSKDKRSTGMGVVYV